MNFGRKIASGLLGLIFLSGCATKKDELKYRIESGVVKGGVYDNLFYKVTFHEEGTMINLAGYGGKKSITPLRVQAYDKDNDGNFDSVTRENIEYNPNELMRIIGEAGKEKY